MDNLIFLFIFSISIGLSFTQYYERPHHYHSPYAFEDGSSSVEEESSYERDTCSSNREIRGRCIPLSQCGTLKAYLRERNKRQVSFILQKYGCGFKENLLVCCPTNNLQEERTTRRPSTSYWYNPDLTSSQKDSWFWPKPSTTEETTRPWRRTTTEESSRPYRRTTTTTPYRQTRSTTSSWFDRRTTTTKRQENLFYDEPITNHRNRRLLPLDSCGADLNDKIIGGTNAQLNEFPWTVLLQHTSTDGRRVGYGCGGSLINSRYVVTAAHCISGAGVPKNMKVTKVRLGEHDISKKRDCQGQGQNQVCSPDPIDAPVEEIIVHPNYKSNDKSQYDDIALIRLRSNIQMSSYVSPICLPIDKIQKKEYTREKLVVAGWGRTSNMKGQSSSSKIKQKVAVPVVSLDECSPFYQRNGIRLRDTQLCAGGQKGKDSCQGDSGGPLMSTDVVDGQIKIHLQGIVSYGPEFCGAEKVAGVYTRVSKYINWILDNMRE